ncbi:MAG: sodium:solute symporter family protein [Gammaproteobacteria bacterium]|nr:sodium:solute symporter family protein [Gammaproteobacteria bacterium]MDH5304218.1 sodium:solute symporter family protein [Gammaproteobacteria bacterium]MDH5322171.1 sodium:solute symporter family protein [Gammaproteobacteria bacterium]
MNIYALAIVISVLVYVLIGNYAGRKVKHLDDYFVAGRQAPTFLILGTLVASVVGTNSFLGDVGMAYDGYGAALILSGPITVAGYVFGALLFGRYIRRSRAATVPEFFGRRFNSRRLRIFAALTVVFGVGGYLMTVTQGAAMVITWITDISYLPALITVWLGYTTFTIYSGSRGVVITDTLMFVLFGTVGLLAIAFVTHSAGGWFHAITALADFEARPGIIAASGYQGPGALWDSPLDMWIWASIFGLAWAMVVAVSPWQSSRYLMARDEHVVIRSACIATVALSVLWTLIYTSGPVIALLNPDIMPSNNAMIWAALNAMPALVGAVLLAGIVAAGLSSASTFLSLVAFSISNDVMAESAASDSTRLFISRLTMLAVGLSTLVLAMFVPPDVFWITQFVGPMFAAVWGPVAIMSVWSRRITEAAAFWGMVAGCVSYLALKSLQTLGLLELPVFLHPILLGFAISLSVVLVVSRATCVSDTETAYLEALHIAPPELANPAANRRTALWPTIMMVWGLVSGLVLLLIYVRPYQLATGLVSTTGPYVVWSGEVLIAIVYGSALVVAGALARFVLQQQSTHS